LPAPAGAVGLGAVYLAAAQAPWVYIVVNGTAFVLGVIAYAALVRWGKGGATGSGAIVLALAVALVATALFGVSADGATRWIRVGSLGVQVSLLFLPLMIVAFARHRDAAGTAGLIVAALAMALQPDRAMAGVLAASLLTLAILRFDIRVGMALVAAVIGFAVTLVRPDTSQASPWVDGVCSRHSRFTRLWELLCDWRFPAHRSRSLWLSQILRAPACLCCLRNDLDRRHRRCRAWQLTLRHSWAMAAARSSATFSASPRLHPWRQAAAAAKPLLGERPHGPDRCAGHFAQRKAWVS
jgi:cell division protein FtsW (lipid II flippase)